MRKVSVQQPNLLLVGVDVSKAKHDACIGTQQGRHDHTFTFTHSREGCRRFETALSQQMDTHRYRRVLIAMEPSGISWQALYDRLKRCGDGVCLVHSQAVRNTRKTLQDRLNKTDEKDAHRLFDLLQQGQCFLPVARDPELQAASRLMRRHMARKKRVGPRRNQLRGAMHLAFPARNALIHALTQPTSLRFLPANPPPATVLRNGRRRCVEKWPPRRQCGQWRPETFHRLSDLAKASLGLNDPYRIDALEIKALAHDLAAAFTKQQLWLDQAIALLDSRPDYQLLMPLPRIGTPTAAAILTAMGDIGAYNNGQQLVKLAGLDIRLFASGASIRKRPNISHVGSAYLRHWLYHSAKRLVHMRCLSRPLSSAKSHHSRAKGRDSGRSLPCQTKSSASFIVS